MTGKVTKIINIDKILTSADCYTYRIRAGETQTFIGRYNKISSISYSNRILKIYSNFPKKGRKK